MKDAISDMANRRSEEICVLLYNRMFCIEFHIFMETGGIRVPDERRTASSRWFFGRRPGRCSKR